MLIVAVYRQPQWFMNLIDLGASPKIMPAEYLRDGYLLKIKKNLTKKLCLSCIEYFFSNQGLRVTQDENYLTIQSPLRIL
jgi:hypothetical protein